MTLRTSIAFAAVAATLVTPAAHAATSPNADSVSSGTEAMRVHFTAASLVLETQVAHLGSRLTVRERGQGIVSRQSFGPGETIRYSLVDQDGQRLADGRYVFEVVLFNGADGQGLAADAARTGNPRLSGTFEVRNGAIASPQGVTEGPSALDNEIDVDQEIADVSIPGDAIVEGSLCASDSTDCLFDAIILDSEDFDTPGFGNSDIKVKDNVPEIWFNDTTEEDGDFAVTVEDSKFFVRDPAADTLPLTVEGGAPTDSIYVTESGSTGINTAVPAAPLHVLASSATGPNTMIVERTDSQTPNIQFRSTGGATSQIWTFLNNANSGVLGFRDATHDFTPLQVVPGVNTVRLPILPSGDSKLAVQRSNATFPIHALSCGAHLSGSGQWVDCSSRELKTDFEELNPEEILNKLAELPVQQWRYKNEGEEASHIGPVAEDFQQVFGMGDGETLAAADTSGVALAAIQGLSAKIERQAAELETKEDQIAALADQNLELRERLAALEAKLLE